MKTHFMINSLEYEVLSQPHETVVDQLVTNKILHFIHNSLLIIKRTPLEVPLWRYLVSCPSTYCYQSKNTLHYVPLTNGI